MSLVKAIIADDHPLFRSALKQAAACVLDEAQIRECADLEGLFELLGRHSETELVFLDLGIPGANGLQGLSQLRNQYPDVLIIMVSATEAPAIMQQAIALGASAYVPKSSPLERISEAIAEVLNGETWLPADLALETLDADDEQTDFARNLEKLTQQQYKVLAMIADGLLNKQIAYEMQVQETTVKQHVSAILRKLGLNNRTQAGIRYNQLSRPE
ncbi:response regulator transcription factor [Shewanella algae]|uniref:response regulator transcription factor n=1 Tax=Shewanella algae TaxID=38313 RepID=UPI0031F58796